MELSDQWLLRAYCGGDREAFDALFRRYAPRVHATAYRLTGAWEDAEDTLQDVFIRLAKEARSLRSAEALSTWIYRVTVNRAVDCLRRRRSSQSLDDGSDGAARVIAVASMRLQAERDEARRRDGLLAQIESLIPRLPDRQGAAFVLRGFQGLPHAEIARVLGCGESAAKSHYSLACRKLREWVKAEEEAEEQCKMKNEK
ncbi:MAG: RNA polymerase sigma factor [Candidatus Sumerlaeota bacterium]|nr:RNA polymerase sigma factor [Candidatus Sumerlaeota bacterium]